MAYTSILTLESYVAAEPLIVVDVETIAFDVEQTLNIGSQSSGSGAGKITFNPFSITRHVDKSSPTLFLHCASGTPFKTAKLTVTPEGANAPFITYLMKLVAIKTIAVQGNQHGGPLPLENVSFEYGGLQIKIGDPSTGDVTTGGWNRVKNVQDNDINSVIT